VRLVVTLGSKQYANLDLIEIGRCCERSRVQQILSEGVGAIKPIRSGWPGSKRRLNLDMSQSRRANVQPKGGTYQSRAQHEAKPSEGIPDQCLWHVTCLPSYLENDFERHAHPQRQGRRPEYQARGHLVGTKHAGEKLGSAVGNLRVL
jgi:hypothetical protein